MVHTPLHLLAGCSGFSYKEWKDRFYPNGVPARRWFEYYCTQFPTLELNVTFYRFPKPAALRGWYDRSPPAFIFSVKVPRLITHYKQFNDTGALQSECYTLLLDCFREKLGPVLYQLPPQLTYSDPMLTKILEHMDPHFTNVIEFRHPSWWCAETFAALREKKITFCSSSYPGLPDPVIPGEGIVYYRFHGVPSLYRSSYDLPFLRKVVEQSRRTGGVHTVYCYFNNTASLAAIDNARAIVQMV